MNAAPTVICNGEKMNTVSKKGVSRRTFVKIGAAATSVLAMRSIARAQQRMLTYATWGGASQESQRASFFNEFEKETGIRVIDIPGTDQAKLAAMVQNGAVEWDLMDSIP